MKVVIYQTSDIHAYIYPTNYVKDVPLGILQVASFMRQDQDQYDAVLKIDCGDLIQGSPMSHYLSKQGEGANVIVSGMEAFGYDAYVLGNHEFNYGLAYLKNTYLPVQDKILNANIEGLPFSTKPYSIFTYGGCRIACIGLTTSFLQYWELEEHIKGLRFFDPVEMYRRYEPELKAQADIIIVCYHGGFERSVDEAMKPTEALTKENQASELLASFDSIDILLTGHQHRLLMCKVHGVICAQTMANAQSFTKIVLDTETKKMQAQSTLTSTCTTPILSEYEQIFHQTQQLLYGYLDQKIGEFTQDMRIQNVDEARLFGHPMINFIHQVQQASTGAQISVTSLFDSAIGFSKDVRIRDVIINYPYPNTLRVLLLSGHKIKEAIEKSATYFVLDHGTISINEEFLTPKKQSYNYDMFAGLQYEIDVRKPFYHRVRNMRFQGAVMDLDRDYRVVMNNYRASNTSIYPCYEGAKVIKESSVDMGELMMDYIQKQGQIQVDDTKNFTILM